MSNEPKFKAPRSLQEIQAEYGQVLQRAGQCQYQIEAFKKDLDMFNSALRDLNAEAFAAHEAAEKLKAEEAKKKADEEEAKKKSEEESKPLSLVKEGQ